MSEADTLNVLLVDDSQVARSHLVELFEKIPSVRVIAQAADGAEAIRQAKQKQPDLVLMDLVMPNIDGIVALRMLCGGVPGIRVAVVSSLGGSKRVAQEAFRLGAIQVLSKPVEAEDVARLCAQERARKMGDPISDRADSSQPLAIKFYGQFLLEQKAVNLSQLREAIDLTHQRSIPLEQLAVELSLLTPQQADHLRKEATESGYSIRELIEEDGLLNAQELNQLVATREAGLLDLGQALVLQGYLEEGQEQALRERYNKKQGSIRPPAPDLPEQLSGHRPAQVLLELIPGYLKRVTGHPAEIGWAEAVPNNDLMRVTLFVRGAVPMRVELVADREFAGSIQGKLAEPLEPAAQFQMLHDGLLEFLNVIVGNALTILESDGLHLSIAPPGRAPAIDNCATLEVQSPAGKAWVCIDIDPKMPERVSQLDMQLGEPQ